MTERLVIVLANRKGGTGKTTSAAYIAQALHCAGQAVTGVDVDPDQSWLKWHGAGALPYAVTPGDPRNLTEQIDQLSGVVIIDTPPNDGEIIYKAAGVADEVIIPLAPTSLDVGRLMTTIKTVADVERMRRAPLASVLLTRWRANFTISQEVDALLRDKNIPLLDARIRSLTRYTAFDTPTYLEEYQAALQELGVM